MPTPSLILVPARFKTGKLYTPVATTSGDLVLGASGDFNVTRDTTATRVNESGLVEVVASGIPRLDYYTSGGTAGCPALLVEASGTNLVLQSEAFNITWSGLAGATVTPNTIAAPDNNVTADTINLTTTTDSRVQQSSITIANSTTYTMSCFYKNIALTAVQTFRMRFNNTNSAPNNFIAAAAINLAAGTAAYSIGGTSGTGFSGTPTGRVENYGNGWYRFSMTFTVGSAGGTASGIFEAGNSNQGQLRSFYAWGAQLEVGSIATSYIPTTTAAVTRNADVINLSGAVSGCIGQTEGTLYAEVDVRNFINESRIVCLSDGTSDNRIILQEGANSTLQAIVTNATSGVVDISTASGRTAGIYKIAIGYKQDDFAVYVNGSQTGTEDTGGVPACNQIFIGKIETTATTNQFNDRLRSAALYTTRLTDSELAALTTL